MAVVCPNCGTEAAEGDRFCSNCGTELAGLAGAERKLATMVFVDLVDSTQLASELDPEAFRARLEPFFETARTSLREHGGTIEKYLGDAVLAAFGVPRAHTDDPDRAVAAALDLSEKVSALGQGLAVRIGVESGEVLAEDGGGDLSVTGEAVNAAARLQQAAKPGEVLVGERAMRYCRRARFEPQGTIEAKGLPEPLRSWRALEAAAAPTDGPSTPLLGRDDDLDLLRIVYRRAVRERIPELVIITGEAGIGKTRLASELLSELRRDPEPPRILLGRNPPYGRGIAFWALAEILRDAAGKEEDVPVSEVESSLASLLEELGADDAGEVATNLSVALGGDGDKSSMVGEDEVKHAWRRFVALLAEERPLVLGVDDAHWADDGLLDLLEEAVFRVQTAPLVLICTGRPELAERRPDFGRTTRNVTQIELRPLQQQATTQLVELLVPEEAKEMAPRAAEASGGNPFFAEEVARRIVEEPDSALADRLPDTVQAAIASRIDLLPADEKCALQYASVLGHSFSRGALGDLLSQPADELLTSLERRALVQERAAGPGHFSFRHQLIRDVAYASLPRSERAELHERAAEQIRTRAGERLGELSELVAFHLGRAADLAPSEARGSAACRSAFEAAEAAARRGAVSRAQELFEQVAELETDDRDRVEPLRAAADLALRRWLGVEAMPLLREAAAAAERAGDTDAAASAYARAVEVAGRMSGISGHLPEEEVKEMLRKGHELVSDEDQETRARLLLDEVWIAWHYGRPEEMSAYAPEALRLAREVGDPVLLSSALDAATADDWNRGQQQHAVEQARERLVVIDRAPRSHALDIERSDALHMMIESLLQAGEFREAATYAAQARELDHARGVEYSAWERELLTTFLTGEWDRTMEMGARFREEWNAAGGPPIAAMCTAVGTVGAILAYRGDDARSAEWFEFTLSIPPDISVSGQESGVLMLQGDAALHRGRPAAAAELLARENLRKQWWVTPYQATRAEAFVLAGRPDAERAIALAADRLGEHVYAQGVLLRARGLAAGDDGLIRESLEVFRRLECPHQAARSGWLLGGEGKEEAAGTFERLGAVLPA